MEVEEVLRTEGGKEPNVNIDCGNSATEESESGVDTGENNVGPLNSQPLEDQENAHETPESAKEESSDSVKNAASEVFKKPVLLVGPRKGKAAGKVQVYKSVGKPNVINECSEQEQAIVTDDDVDSSSTLVNSGETTEDVPKSSSEDSFKSTIPDQCSSTQETHKEKKVLNKPSTAKASPAQLLKESLVPLPYKEPKWSGVPAELYRFEVIKNGSILEMIDVSSKPFYVFGRLATCDIHMAHPTVSRYHAVLQYRSDSSEEPTGFYLYDLGSTHGTFLNKYRIKPNMYVRIRVGHLLKLGGSSRMFILQGPEEDMEQESELSVTELKQKRKEEEQARELLEIKCLEEERSKQEAIEKQGIDWGMGDDAEEEADLSENPFAATPNEELYLDDPKKTLRGWFEREGYDLEYKVEEKGYGQFLCAVELPVEHAKGSSLMAEVLVKGKKKEAVVQCALEACRILDRYGLLRQANHESKKRKSRNWEENDYYDSDEDTFLDRTGAVEKKRQQRMKAAGKVQAQTETYETLVSKHEDIVSEIQKLLSKLNETTGKTNLKKNSSNEEEDALDAFMTNLSSEIPDKKLIGKLKAELSSLRQEEARLQKLVKLTCPAVLPELIKKNQPTTVPAAPSLGGKRPPLIGNRKNLCKMALKLQDTGATDVSSADAMEDDGDEVEDEKQEENVEQGQEKEEEDRSENERSEDISAPVESAESTSVDKSNVSVEETTLKSTDKKPDPGESKTNASPAIKRIFGPTLPPQSVLVGAEKRKKRNRHKGAKKGDNEYDATDPKYSMWVPPDNQSGDGKTKLNDKYGY